MFLLHTPYMKDMNNGFKIGQRVLVGDYASGVIVAFEKGRVIYRVEESEMDAAGSLASEALQFVYSEDTEDCDCWGGFRS